MKQVNTYVISDLHLGHENIERFRNITDNDERICDGWADVVKRNTDKVWVLGDAAFTVDALIRLDKLPGRKFLCRGNHDLLPTKLLAVAFEEIYGIYKYKRSKHFGAWLSHAPIHPVELRGCNNIHGHVHYKDIETDDWAYGQDSQRVIDTRYVNVCVERVDYKPVLLRDLLVKKGTTE
jgi:calcineurin-like phosphoesterase family protein